MTLFVPGLATAFYGGLAALLLVSLAPIVGVSAFGARQRATARRPALRAREPRRVGLSRTA